MEFSWDISNSKRRCCECSAFHIPSNLGDSCGQKTGNGQFSFQPQMKGIQRMSTQLLNCTHLTQSQRTAQNSPSQASTECEPWASRCSSWVYKGQRNLRLNCQHPLCPPKSNITPGKHLLLFDYAKDFEWHTQKKNEQGKNHIKMWNILQNTGIHASQEILHPCKYNKYLSTWKNLSVNRKGELWQ